jgi:hypothetical protein
MKIIEPRIHTVKDSYKFFKKNSPQLDIPYWMYREVLARVFKRVSDQIIFGGMFNLQNNLGYVRIKKIKRNYAKLVPDWGASNKLKAGLIAAGKVPKDQNNPKGEEWLVFYSDPWYLRWAWIKAGVCRVKNQSVYMFRPTANRSKTAGDNNPERLGNRGLLVLANKLNPVLHYNYDY